MCSLGFGAFESMETGTWRRANQVAITFPVTQFKTLRYFMEVERLTQGFVLVAAAVAGGLRTDVAYEERENRCRVSI